MESFTPTPAAIRVIMHLRSPDPLYPEGFAYIGPTNNTDRALTRHYLEWPHVRFISKHREEVWAEDGEDGQILVLLR